MNKRILAVTLVMMLVAPAAYSQEWRIEPFVRVGYEIDDNATLNFLTIEEDDISGYIADANVRFAYSSETSEFFAAPRLVHRNYGDPEFDADDQFFVFDWDRNTQFTNFRIRGNYGREMVRTAERVDADLDIDDPDDIVIDTSGRVGIRDRRERAEIRPEFTYRMSNVSAMRLEMRYVDVTYDENFLGLLNDYNDFRANLSYRRDWSTRSTVVFGATFREYEAEDREPVTGTGIGGGIESRLSETTMFKALVGIEDTKLDSGESDVNWVANLSLTRRLETITMLAQYRRVIAGGGGGSLTARDILNLNFTRRLSDRISAGIGVRAYTTTALEEGVFTIDERDYLQLRAQFVWNLSQTVSMDFNYRYTILDREIVGEAANSNNVMVWLNWRPSPYSSSR
jgi:hypothetical protein